MVIRITRILLALQVLVAVAIACAASMVWGVAPLPAAIFGITVIILLRLAITANNFVLAHHYRRQDPEVPALGWRQAIRLFLTEFGSTMLSSSWTMPFFAFSRRHVPDPTSLPVLLIHGYGCNSGYWHSMSKALLRAGIPHDAISLEPMFCNIDDYVESVHRAVQELCAATGCEKIVILAHSMGGLVARAYLRDKGTGSIAKVITLGTPHRGTGLANFGMGENCAQMRWSGNDASAWLRTLAESENKKLRSLFVSIYSLHDNIISPPNSSCLPGAGNIAFHGIGHVALAFHPEVRARVIEEILAAGEPALAAMRRARKNCCRQSQPDCDSANRR